MYCKKYTLSLWKASIFPTLWCIDTARFVKKHRPPFDGLNHRFYMESCPSWRWRLGWGERTISLPFETWDLGEASHMEQVWMPSQLSQHLLCRAEIRALSWLLYNCLTSLSLCHFGINLRVSWRTLSAWKTNLCLMDRCLKMSPKNFNNILIYFFNFVKFTSPLSRKSPNNLLPFYISASIFRRSLVQRSICTFCIRTCSSLGHRNHLLPKRYKGWTSHHLHTCSWF